MNDNGIYDGNRQLAALRVTDQGTIRLDGTALRGPSHSTGWNATGASLEMSPAAARELRDLLDREVHRLTQNSEWAVYDGGEVVANVYATEDNLVEVDAAELPLVLSVQAAGRLQKTLAHAALMAHLNTTRPADVVVEDDDGQVVAVVATTDEPGVIIHENDTGSYVVEIGEPSSS